ncbi:hypothetical protein [Prosthecobacter algae]|uniref:hypothetical protein n=1 Tax=Prosthecobacter algae TaxID=1144682 RepID=UPI0031ED0826
MGSIAAYSHGITVTAENALHDRITARLRGWTALREIVGETPLATVQTFSPLLSVPAMSLRQTRTAGAFGIVFGRPEGRASDRVSFRSRAIELPGFRHPIPAMLPQVKLHLRGIRDGAGVNAVYGEATATLNATRYMRQRGFRRRLDLGPNQDVFRHSEYFRPPTNGEHSLDGNDNWFPADESGAVGWNDDQARSAPVRFLSSLHARIASEFQRAASLSPDMAATQAALSGSLQQVETYWEFWHDEPLRLVQSLQREALQFGGQVRSQIFETATDGHSLGLSFSVTAGTRLRIYAKTNRRVRFEVEHSLERSRRGFSSTTEITALLSAARTDAAETVNGFLDFVHPQRPVHFSQCRSPLALVCEIVHAVHGNYSHAQSLLEALSVHSRLTTVRNSPLRPAIIRLVENGIFQPSRPRSRSYVPSPVWRYAGEVLAQQDRLNELVNVQALAQRRR